MQEPGCWHGELYNKHTGTIDAPYGLEIVVG